MKSIHMNSSFRGFLVLLALGINMATIAVRAEERICDLDCPNGAPCVFGNADFSGRVGVIGTANHQDGMHCDCPMGWTGLTCDKKFETCSNQNGHECYNGGECIPGLQDKYQNEQLFCDCSKASGFIGKYCETHFKRTCPHSTSDGDDGFCVNGGECNPDFPEFSPRQCLCDDAYGGYHCEYDAKKIPECNLDCQNGGECFVGIFPETDEHMVCKCPPGFGGTLCEAPAEMCGDESNHVCFNGGTCVTTSMQTPGGKIRSQHHCDCTKATNDNYDLFAGKFCEHIATSVCSDNDFNLFCTQGGKCKMNPIDGCTCESGTTGYKCEFSENDSSSGGNNNHNNGHNHNHNNDQNHNHSAEYDHEHMNDHIHNHENEHDYDHHHDQNHDNNNDKNEDLKPCAGGYCLNGSSCATEKIISEDGTQNVKEFCDCSHDENSKYAGLYCQYKATNLCLVEEGFPDANDETFCLHNGSCQPDGSCVCPSGWTGRYCEMKLAEAGESAASVENPNGVNDLDQDIGGNGDVNTGPTHPGSGFKNCDDTICYNGGVCALTEHVNSDGSIVMGHQCDCSMAFDETYLYAGTGCEFPATVICSVPDDGQGLKGSSFCTNHGNCTDDAALGCDCMPGFSGPACEFEDHSVEPPVDNNDIPNNSDANDNTNTSDNDSPIDCQLKCMNGGNCAHGAKDLGSLKDIIGDVSHLNQTYANDYFAHCVCAEGWVGPTCEQKLDICGEGEHVCLHGSKCVPDTSAESEYTCDCSEADDVIGNNGKTAFAGDSCQYHGTEICTIGDPYPGQPLFFCVNGGSCNAWVSAESSDHPGCACPENYDGPHCEINTTLKKKLKSRVQGTNEVGVLVLFVMALLLVVLVLTGVVVIQCIESRRNQSNNEESAPLEVADKASAFNKLRRPRRKFQPKATSSVSDLPSSYDGAHPGDDFPQSEYIDRKDGVLSDPVDDYAANNLQETNVV